MSSDDAHTTSQNKHSSSTFADVFKTLGAGRPKSQSPVSHGHNSAGGTLSPAMEGRRGSRVTFGFESLHRGSTATSVPEAPPTPSLETVLQNISQDQPVASAIEEAERATRSLYGFNADQAIAIWEVGGYLLDHPDSVDARHVGSTLLENIASRQDLSPTGRQVLFHDITRTSPPDVIPGRVKALISLSDYGRKLDFADSAVLPIIAPWIVPLYELTATLRSKLKRAKGQRPNGIAFDETILGELFQLIVDVVTLPRHPPGPDDIGLVLDEIFVVCKRTSAAVDIKNSLAVFDAFISTSDIPDSNFIPLLEVLCSIHASVKSLAGPTSRAVRSLAKSGKQVEMVDNLHTFLLETSERPDRNLNVTRGAVDIFRDLLVAYGQEGMPTISFDRLITSLQHASLRNDGRIDTDILEVCLNALQGEFISVALQHNWTEFVDLILACSHRVIDIAPTSPNSTPAISPTPALKSSIIDDVRSNIAANVTRIAGAIEVIWTDLDRPQRQEAMRLLADIHQNLTPTQSELVLRSLSAENSCSPQSETWVSNSWKLVKDFMLARDKPAETRVSALAVFKDAYFSDNAATLFCREGFLRALLDDFVNEDAYLFLEELVSFFVDITEDCDDDTLSFLVYTLSLPMNQDKKRDEIPPTAISSNPVSRPATTGDVLIPSLSNVTTSGLVRIFSKSLQSSSSIISLVFEKLIDIARSPLRASDARLTALKLLFKLRCDNSGSIYMVSEIGSGHLVAVLSRTIDATSKSNTSDGSSATSKDDERMPNQISRLSMKDPLSGPLTSLNVRGSRTSRWIAPVWTSDEPRGQLDDLFPPSRSRVYAYKNPVDAESPEEEKDVVLLRINLWVEAIIALLQSEKDWDVYSYVLAHISPQLVNRDFFRAALPQIKLLRSVLCEQIKNESFHEPLGWTGVKKGDIATCILEALTMLISFHQYFAKSEQDEIVRTFMLGIGSWEGTSRGCIHSLSVCCHEIPLSVTKSLNAILDKMSKVITRANIAVHILEFLALLARLPEVYVNLRDEEIRTVFGICLRFIDTSREQRYKTMDAMNSRSASLPERNSGSMPQPAAYSTGASVEARCMDDLSRYVYHLTYHVMVFWFLSLKLQDRANHVSWITKRLVFTDENGKEVIEEQSQVFIDMMQRVAYSDLGDTIPFEKFPPSDSDGPVAKRTWIVGISIITLETAGATGLTQLTKRQASGTTYVTYQQRTAPVLPHQTPPSFGSHSLSDDPSTLTAILPNHILVQMTTSAFPTPTVMQPLPLPDDDFTRRAISSFDRNDIVDGHKIGVIYIGEGQTDESQILANTSGSQDYEFFIAGLGTKVSIENPKFNPQGLHPGTDGEFTYAWRDRVSEIVYHIATMMPTNLEADPQCVNKKQHIGNDFVNIIFNRSNLEFNFNTITTQFNFVNIVVTPVSWVAPDSANEIKTVEDFNQSFYLVKVIGKPGFPELSASAAAKVVSGKNLAAFIRLIALNASAFSLVSSRGGEHVSSWQNRLREIRRLRDRAFTSLSDGTDISISSTNTSVSDAPYATQQRRNTKPTTHAEETPNPNLRANFGTERNLSIDNNVFQNLDFSRWSR